MHVQIGTFWPSAAAYRAAVHSQAPRAAAKQQQRQLEATCRFDTPLPIWCMRLCPKAASGDLPCLAALLFCCSAAAEPRLQAARRRCALPARWRDGGAARLRCRQPQLDLSDAQVPPRVGSRAPTRGCARTRNETQGPRPRFMSMLVNWGVISSRGAVAQQARGSGRPW